MRQHRFHNFIQVIMGAVLPISFGNRCCQQSEMLYVLSKGGGNEGINKTNQIWH